MGLSTPDASVSDGGALPNDFSNPWFGRVRTCEEAVMRPGKNRKSMFAVREILRLEGVSLIEDEFESHASRGRPH